MVRRTGLAADHENRWSTPREQAEACTTKFLFLCAAASDHKKRWSAVRESWQTTKTDGRPHEGLRLGALWHKCSMLCALWYGRSHAEIRCQFIYAFNEVPFLERFGAAADCGFKAVEFLFPYEHTPEAILEQAQKHSLEIVLFNMRPETSPRVSADSPASRTRSGVPRGHRDGSDLFDRVENPSLACHGRDRSSGADPVACRTTLIANLKYAAQQLAPHGVTVLLEAINSRDIPGFFVNTQAESFRICAAVDEPNLKMQMDLYHMQVMEGDLARKLREYAPTADTFRLPALLQGTSPIPEKYATSICLNYWMRSDTRDGSVANTGRPGIPRWPGVVQAMERPAVARHVRTSSVAGCKRETCCCRSSLSHCWRARTSPWEHSPCNPP